MRTAGKPARHSRRPHTVAVALAAAAAWAASLAAWPLRADLPPEHTAGIDLNDPAVVKEGGESFNGLCAGYCHGTAGTAKRGPALRNRPELDAYTLYSTIVNGRRRSGNPMPGWKDLLSDEEVWTIVAYIISLRDAPPAYDDSSAAPETE